jgi:hypothetical protein
LFSAKNIIGPDHPVMVEMFSQQIVGMLCCFIDLFNYVISVLNPLITSINFQTKVLFKAADSQAKGETTAIKLCAHPSQQKVFRSSRYAETACHARVHLGPHSLLNSTEFKDWLAGGPAN